MIIPTTIATALLFGSQCRNSNCTTTDQHSGSNSKRCTFQNPEDGFRVHVPDGWVGQDVDSFHLPVVFVLVNEGRFFDTGP